MNITKKNINDITPNEKNTRKHSDAQINELWKSVDKFGTIRPIVIDENGVILAGHGLFEAYKRNGVEEVDVLIIDNLSESDKKKLLLADNKIYAMGVDDYSTIEEILAELGKDNDFEVPGYDSDILEEMYGIKSVEDDVKASDTPVQQVVKEINEKSKPSARIEEARKEAVEEAEKYVICPNCGEKVYL